MDNPFAVNLEERFEELKEREEHKNKRKSIDDLIDAHKTVHIEEKPQEVTDKLKLEFDIPEITYKNLNQGVFQNKWYFGKAKEWKEEKHTVNYGTETNPKPKIIVFPQFLGETLIFSNGSYLQNNLRNKKDIEIGKNEIKEHNIRYKHELELHEASWTWRGKNGIFNFLNGSCEVVDVKKLYNEIREELDFYIDVTDERMLDVATAFILHSYCYELFNSVAQIQFYGEKKSAKTKFMKLITLLGFKGLLTSSITESNIFRVVQNNKGILAIDEYEEQKESERKQNTDLLLNAGNQKGVSIIRQEKDEYGKFRGISYDVFCPKMVASITGMNDVTESRFIKFTMIKAKQNNPKLNREIDVKTPKYQEIRNKCFVFVMQNWAIIQKIYERIDMPQEIHGRYADMWKPILTIAELCDRYKEIEGYALMSIKDSKEEQSEKSYDYFVLSTILESMSSNSADNILVEKIENITPKTMAIWLSVKENIAEHDLPKYIRTKSYSIGQVLTRCKPIIESGRNNSERYWKISIHKLIEIMMRRDYSIPQEYEPIVQKLLQKVKSDEGDEGDAHDIYKIEKNNNDEFDKINKNSVTINSARHNCHDCHVITEKEIIEFIELKGRELKDGVPFGILCENFNAVKKEEMNKISDILKNLDCHGVTHQVKHGRWKKV